MKILGIDYGERKVGLAVAVGSLADPLVVIRYESEFDLFSRLEQVIEESQIEKIVVGVSEGVMALKQKEFASKVYQRFGVVVDLHDETLSTKDAQQAAISAGIKRVKRKKMEDAYAAALILQSYING